MSEGTSTGRNDPLESQTAESRLAGLDRSFAMATGLAAAESRIAEVTRSLGLAAESRVAGLHDVLGLAAKPMVTEVTRSLGLAADFKFAGLDRVLGLTNAAFKVPFSPVTTQALLGTLADIVSNDVFGSISALGSIDVDRIVENFATLAREDSANAFLYRERVRQLRGSYIYIQVWIIVLLVLLGVFKFNETVSSPGIANMMTEVGGRSIASEAREIALENFDRTYPPDSEVPSIPSILI